MMCSRDLLPFGRFAVCGLILFLVVTAVVHAQGRPRAVVTPLVETDAVQAGKPSRVALRVTLPEGLHVQSDQPRDPLLIPTVLAITPPPGARLTALVYPIPTDFTQQTQPEPLSVFEHDFVVGADLQIETGVSLGELVVPGSFRYQACDDKVCFPPLTVPVHWTLRVVPAGTTIAATNAEVFAELSRGRRTEAPAPILPAPVGVPPAANADGGLARLDDGLSSVHS
jgi:DsbC/DsbD-like thiol-disulfide interchange protein